MSMLVCASMSKELCKGKVQCEKKELEKLGMPSSRRRKERREGGKREGAGLVAPGEGVSPVKVKGVL